MDRGPEAAELALERPDSADALALIAELENELSARYPPESRHGYSVEKLLREGVAFFVVRIAAKPAGCGGVQVFGNQYAELKRMYVRPQFSRPGAGHADARAFGCARAPAGRGVVAARLYESYGFRRRPPFGPYREDPLSLYYEKRI